MEIQVQDIQIVYTGENFGEFLKEFRQYMGLTQRELKDKTGCYSGMSYSSIRSYEQNRKTPKYPADIIQRLREVFEEEMLERSIRLLIVKTNKKQGDINGK